MVIIRPIQPADLDDLLLLAKQAGVGVTTLPADRDLLRERITLSIQSFQKQCAQEQANYLFALVDTELDTLLGVSAIEAHVGCDDSWYNYRVGKAIHASKALQVYSENEVLYLSNDLTGATELCSLFLHQDFRKGKYGRFLSKCRFLFLADFSAYFGEKVIAEMRGYSDESGRSPFWEAVGRHFFRMDFAQADALTVSGNKAFVAELMPKHPLYTYLLPDEAQDVIAKVHDKTKPALAMLEEEGFRYNGFVDIFDAGPIVESFTNTIRSVVESRTISVELGDQSHPGFANNREGEFNFLISNRQFETFRVLMISISTPDPDLVFLSQMQLDEMNLKAGDHVRILPIP